MLLPMDYETSLRDALERHLTRADGQVPSKLAESIRYSLLSPGKRIRPRLLLATAEMLGLPSAAALPAAHALEMIHTFTLIHDDLPCMDDDDLRRGQPTNHKRFGEATALLAGDALIALAIEVFLESRAGVSPDAHARALSRLLWASGARGVSGGQALEETLTTDSSLEDLQKMHALKTGALFLAAMTIPATLAGLTDESAASLAIDLFGRELGLAFQIADDLEDAATESTALTNILAYVSKAEAQNMTLGRLAQATRSLEAVFGDKAKPVRLIADEVARRIGGPTPTQIQSTAQSERASEVAASGKTPAAPRAETKNAARPSRAAKSVRPRS